MIKIKILALLTTIMLWTSSGFATTYYINSLTGNDNNIGTDLEHPLQTLSKVNSLPLKARDQVLLATGQVFKGTLKLENRSGTAKHPIFISSYEEVGSKDQLPQPIIDAKGLANGILLINCNHIIVDGLEITANGGDIPGEPNPKQSMRCGVLVTTSTTGIFENIILKNLLIQDIFFENAGFQRGKDEVRTANGSQSYGWGIRFINATEGATLSGLKVASCIVKNVAHTGIKFTGKNKSIHNISLTNNQVSASGGPGIQMSGVHQGHIHHNQVDHSGSNNDTRKWGRGSGLWTWGSSDILIEHNTFKNANGPGDSAGCHIDFNCTNVIVQYNLSANNAGGFCEILGNNYNCAYRYNISINDGYRIKNKDGAFQEGKIFWLSGYAGKGKARTGPFNSYFYNNTIYVKKGIVAKIAIDRASSGIFIANNIFYLEGESKVVLGDQYKPEKAGTSQVKDVVFQNNLYLNANNWPDEVLIQDAQPLFGDPRFAQAGGNSAADYSPTHAKILKNKGIPITPLPNDSIGLYLGLQVKRDFFGNKIKGKPDLGAIEFKNKRNDE